MCYIIKEYVYMFIVLASVNVKVPCNVEDYITKHNIVISSAEKDYNPNTSDEIFLSDHMNSNERNYKEDNQENYGDRLIFPDDDYNSYESTTSPSPQEFGRCVLACNVNTTYDPVCGTDNITYINLERLECRRNCGEDVRLRQLSACPEWSEATTPSPIIGNEIFKSCFLSCPSTPEYNPVCGTDSITYFNYGKMLCAQICGADVQVERHAPCPKQPQTTTESIFSTSSILPYELSQEYYKCLEICPTTSEYNPVCGSNDKTYYNIGKLYCAKNCGVDVTVLKNSPCSIEISINLNINTNKNEVSTSTTTTPRRDDFTIPQDILDRIFNNHGDKSDETTGIDVRNKDELY